MSTDRLYHRMGLKGYEVEDTWMGQGAGPAITKLFCQAGLRVGIYRSSRHVGVS